MGEKIIEKLETQKKELQKQQQQFQRQAEQQLAVFLGRIQQIDEIIKMLEEENKAEEDGNKKEGQT